MLSIMLIIAISITNFTQSAMAPAARQASRLGLQGLPAARTLPQAVRRPVVPSTIPARQFGTGFVKQTPTFPKAAFEKSVTEMVREADIDWVLTYGNPYEVMSALQRLGKRGIEALPLETLQNLDQFISKYPSGGFAKLVRDAFIKAQEAQAEALGIPAYRLPEEVRAAIARNLREKLKEGELVPTQDAAGQLVQRFPRQALTGHAGLAELPELSQDQESKALLALTAPLPTAPASEAQWLTYGKSTPTYLPEAPIEQAQEIPRTALIPKITELSSLTPSQRATVFEGLKSVLPEELSAGQRQLLKRGAGVPAITRIPSQEIATEPSVLTTTYQPPFMEPEEFETPRVEYPEVELGYQPTILGSLIAGLILGNIVNYIKDTYGENTSEGKQKLLSIEYIKKYPQLNQALIDFILTKLNIPATRFEGKSPEEIVRRISDEHGKEFNELYSSLAEKWYNRDRSLSYNVDIDPNLLEPGLLIAESILPNIFFPYSKLLESSGIKESGYTLFWQWIDSGQSIDKYVDSIVEPIDLTKKINKWKNSWKTRINYNIIYYRGSREDADEWLENELMKHFPDSKEAIRIRTDRVLNYAENKFAKFTTALAKALSKSK